MNLQAVAYKDPKEFREVLPETKQYFKQIKADLTVEERGLILDEDLLRIIRGYKCEPQDIRYATTLKRVRLWIQNAMAKGFPSFAENPTLNEEKMQHFNSIMPVSIIGQDKFGHVVSFEKCSEFDIGEAKQMPGEDLLAYRDHLSSMFWNRSICESRRRGKPIYQKIVICDMENISIWNGKEYLDVIKKQTERDSELFAETVYKIFFINCGWAFSALWALASLFVHETTQKKINVLGYAYQSYLLEEIPADQLPEELGGKSKVPIKWGGATFHSEGETIFQMTEVPVEPTKTAPKIEPSPVLLDQESKETVI